MFTDFIKNNFVYRSKYKTHSEAVIISCYFNPQRSPYRLKAFQHYYNSIKHLNHLIVECVIGDDLPQLTSIVPPGNRKTFFTKNLLWHKEALLNQAIKRLPEKYKYVFWIDADVIFTNQNWLREAVEVLKYHNIVQPFEHCIHLDKDKFEPEFDVALSKIMINGTLVRESRRIWRSFAYNWVEKPHLAKSENYDTHGHVGFAWGAKRSCLEEMSTPLYDKALVGGADHVMAHACVGQIPHKCITKSFTEDIDDVNKWSREFFVTMQGRLGYVPGDLYHIWHGDIGKRQYLKRIVDFTPKAKAITKRDNNGLYETEDDETIDYMTAYFLTREIMDDNCCNDIFHKHREKEEHERNISVLDNVNVDIPSVNVMSEEVAHERHHHDSHNHESSHESHVDSTHVDLNENFS